MTDLPKGWVEATLDELNDSNRPICYGILKPGPDLDGGVPYVKVKHIRDERVDLESLHRTSTEIDDKYKRSRLVGGDLLVSIRGTYGRVAPVPDELAGGNITQDTARIAPVGVRASYIQKYLQGPAAQTFFAEVARGVAVKGVNIRDLRQTPVRVPPLAEQERIVASIERAFSKLDAGEAGLRTVRQLLKRMRDAVLAAAVTGRLVPQDSTDTPATKRLADRGIEPRGQHALPTLPDGWAWASLGSIASTVRNGIFVSRPPECPPGIPILRIGAVRRLSLDVTDVRYAPLDLDDRATQKALLEPGDLLFTRYNGNPEFVGACAVVPPLTGPLLHPDKLIRVALDAEVASPGFVATAVSSGPSRAFIDAVTKTTAGQAGIAGSDLRLVPVPIAPVEEQARIVTEVERQMSFVAACERAVEAGLERSVALRRSVLKAAFEGRLVPQDPTDEPASVLLEQIRAERAVAPTVKPRRAKAKS